jgi:hypothetical protein
MDLHANWVIALKDLVDGGKPSSIVAELEPMLGVIIEYKGLLVSISGMVGKLDTLKFKEKIKTSARYRYDDIDELAKSFINTIRDSPAWQGKCK